MTCRNCRHWNKCLKDDKTRYCGKDAAANNVEDLCEWFVIGPTAGVWKYYSTTMMECSVCGRHTARHRYEFCPHCGSEMAKEKIKQNSDTTEVWEQLTLDLNKE